MRRRVCLSWQVHHFQCRGIHHTGVVDSDAPSSYAPPNLSQRVRDSWRLCLVSGASDWTLKAYHGFSTTSIVDFGAENRLGGLAETVTRCSNVRCGPSPGGARHSLPRAKSNGCAPILWVPSDGQRTARPTNRIGHRSSWL